MNDFIPPSCERYISYQLVLNSSSTSVDYYNLLKSNTRAIKECMFEESYSQFKSAITSHFHAAFEFWRGTFSFQNLNPDQQNLELIRTFNEVQNGLNKTDILMMSVAGLFGAVATSGVLILERGFAGFLFKKLPGIEEIGWIRNSLGIGIPAIFAPGASAWLTYRQLNPSLDKEELVSFLNGISSRYLSYILLNASLFYFF